MLRSWILWHVGAVPAILLILFLWIPLVSAADAAGSDLVTLAIAGCTAGAVLGLLQGLALDHVRLEFPLRRWVTASAGGGLLAAVIGWLTSRAREHFVGLYPATESTQPHFYSYWDLFESWALVLAGFAIVGTSQALACWPRNRERIVWVLGLVAGAGVTGYCGLALISRFLTSSRETAWLFPVAFPFVLMVVFGTVTGFALPNTLPGRAASGGQPQLRLTKSR